MNSFQIKKDLFQVFMARIIGVLISLANGFVIPKFLSLDSYAEIKTYMFYCTYLGLFHLGYLDGLYIRYGGKKFDEINFNELHFSIRVFCVFQSIMLVGSIIVGEILSKGVLIAVAFSILPFNMVSLYTLMTQAVGEFKLYRIIDNLKSALIFIANMILLFVFGFDYSSVYIYCQVIAVMMVWIYCSIVFRHKQTVSEHLYNDDIYYRADYVTLLKNAFLETKNNIGAGFVIMISNIMAIWITGIDRWFIKANCSNVDFAYYSFVVSVIAIVNSVTSALSITLYNYFCKELSVEKITLLRRGIMICCFGMVSFGFLLDKLIIVFLSKYARAIGVLYILFIAQIVSIIINSIYLNIFKATGKQRKYLVSMAIALVMAIILDIIVGFYTHFSIEGYAVATLIAYLVWLYICQREMMSYCVKWEEWIYLGVCILGYFISTCCGGLKGFLLYVLWMCIATCLIFRNTVKRLFAVLVLR